MRRDWDKLKRQQNTRKPMSQAEFERYRERKRQEGLRIWKLKHGIKP